MTRWFGQDLVTWALRTCLIVSTRVSTWARFTRISGVPGGTSAAASTSDLGTRRVPSPTTERTTSSGEPNRTHAAAATTPIAASAKNAIRHRGAFYRSGAAGGLAIPGRAAS